MPKEKYVTVCPKCGSRDVTFEKQAAYVYTGLSNQFKQCNNCGYHGMIFPEVPVSGVEEQPLKAEEVKDRVVVQTSFGKGYLRYLLYIAIPLAAIVLLVIATG